MRRILLSIFFIQTITCFSQENYTQYVNPFIGTGGHGHTYPGATVPHGMVQLSPDTRLEGWDGCSGYHYSDSFIYGFSHTHLSGTGCSDYGDILLMPGSGHPSPNNNIYGSQFLHKEENASPGFYHIKLLKNNIDVELTTTERVGIHHYKFSSASDNYVLLDLKHRDEVLESSLKIEDSFTISGLRRSKAWADNQYVFFVMKFSKPISSYGIWQNDFLLNDSTKELVNSKNIKAFFKFNLDATQELFVQVAISPVSIEGAKRNLTTEIKDLSFNQIKKKAEEKWEKELSKIEVKSDDKNKLSIFYTALYHTAIVPNINMDVDGQYRGRDNQIHKAEGFTYYSVFSLWDTYRAAHPLYTIIDRDRTLDYIKTFLAQYKQGGRLPVWELASCETDCMIGYHSIPVIVDAFSKGINDFDTSLALQAMLHAAYRKESGLSAYFSNGVIAMEDEHESVSKTLEYAYDDYCIALFAKMIGNDKIYKEFSARTQFYKNILDFKTGFMRPRKNGNWLSPFDPREVNNNFTEANSWQYSFYFPQDVEGYMQLMGGKKYFESKLNKLFTENSSTTGREQADISGLIGQYAHGNEPSHHIIYLYNYTGKPYMTQYYASKVMNEFYKNEPDGLIGNEDCGQMSAWYVLSALGIYPVTPGNGKYMIGSPQFTLAEIHLENGKSFVVNAPGAGGANSYIESCTISTKKILKPHKLLSPSISHDDIADGGLVSFVMGSKQINCFPEIVKDEKVYSSDITLNPIIEGGEMSFDKTKRIKIYSFNKTGDIYYTLDGSNPGISSPKYKKPVVIDSSTIVKAIAISKDGKKSFIVTAVFSKLLHSWNVKLNTDFEQQYSAGGPAGLVDNIFGSENWRMGNWQGYQKNNFDAVVDLKKVQNISKVSVRFLQDTKSWIIMPKKVSMEISEDGINYNEVFSGKDFLPIQEMNAQVKSVEANIQNKKARFVRIIAEQYGKLPSWHEGAGGDSHIFVDEVNID